MARPGGLGKGLGALIPTGAVQPGASLQELPTAVIHPNPQQPREHFDEEVVDCGNQRDFARRRKSP